MNSRLLVGLLSLVAIFSMVAPAAAQKQKDNFGTEFWVAYGPNEGAETYDQNDNARLNETRNVMDLYITSRVTAHGSVEVAGLGFFKTFTTTPGQITTIHLPSGNRRGASVEVVTTEQVVHGLAVHVTSDSDIAIFGLNHKQYSSDAFMGLPNDVLGTEYRTMNYFTSNPGGHSAPGEFWIVGTEDSTNATITLRQVSSRGTAPNKPFGVRLNKGDVYLVQGADALNNDLTGSHIESDYPIAVFSGSMRCAIPYDALTTDGSPSRDHLVEELPPVSAWGDSALVIPYASATQADLIRAVCAEDQTEIKVNGLIVGTFNAGEFYEITVLPGLTNIQASRPIMVGQYMHTSYGGLGNNPPAYGDPALALVFPVEQFTTAYTIVSIVDASSYTGNFANIVVDQSGVGSMMLDGNPMDPREFKNIPNSRFAYAQHRLQQGTHNISGGKPFGVTIYALGPVDSYAYTGGTLLKTITPLKTVGLAIDFGDRVLTSIPTDTFDTIVYLQNISEDTVNIFSFPKRVQDTTRFYVDAAMPQLPRRIDPGKTDSMKIVFWPQEINRRLHTQITAKTDHLRAYVVDVYGRGVQDEMGVFRESQKVHPIDTLDFGIFTSTDLPVDSAVYIGNAGQAIMNVSSVTLGGADMADFAVMQMTYAGAAVTAPFAVPQPPSEAARIALRFTPSGANGTRLATLEIVSKGSKHTVVLRAHIHTIYALSPETFSHIFDSTMACGDVSYDVVVKNDKNDVPITITSANVGGTDAGEFALSTKVPIVIPAGGQTALSVHFLPTGRGARTANLVIQFDLPKHAPADTIALSGVGEKPTLQFFGSQSVYGYALNQFLVPIYARTDLTPYGATSYVMHLFYDSVYLKLVDVQTAGTLTPVGPTAYPNFYLSSPPGSDTIIFSQGSERRNVSVTPLVGGGAGSLPLIYLKFQPVLNGEDPQYFTKQYSIGYDVNLLDSKLPSTCYDRSFVAASAEISSVCTTPYHLSQESGSTPLSMMLEQSSPNPFGTSTTMEYDVASEGHVKLEVCDAAGSPIRVLVDDVKKPGYYHATLDGLGLPSGAYLIRMTAGDYRRMRRVVLSK